MLGYIAEFQTRHPDDAQNSDGAQDVDFSGSNRANGSRVANALNGLAQMRYPEKICVYLGQDPYCLSKKDLP